MAAAASASPSQRRRSGTTPNIRPLSAAQLLFPDGVTHTVATGVAAGPRQSGGGVENEAFELGSPLSPNNSPRILENCNEQYTLCDTNSNTSSHDPVPPGHPPTALSRQTSRNLRDEIESTNNNIQRHSQYELRAATSGNTSTTTAIIHENTAAESDSNTLDSNVGTFELQNSRKLSDTSRATRDSRTERPSWILDSTSRRKDDNDMWRRRKTDPPGDGKYSYHRDYQEALSSLLWQPYDCRGQGSQTGVSSGNVDDDADVSVWLYPPVLRRPKQNESLTYGFRSSGCQSSSSSSTSSMSSSSSSAVLGATAITTDDKTSTWRSNTEISPSSLSGLIMSTSASIEEGIPWNKQSFGTSNLKRCNSNNNNGDIVCTLPVDGRRRKIGNIPVDPNQHVEEVLDVVSDLHTPWVGTTTATAAVPEVVPVGALPSRCAAGECELCLVPQCESGRQEDCCLCCERDNMLVSVETSTLDTGGSSANNIINNNGACVNTEEEISLVPSTRNVGIVSALTSNNTTFTSSTTNLGSSVSVVSCYRAVPVVVSAVPTIPCSSVCNVHIVQTTPVDSVPTRPGRTFTSTEAQTDDIGCEVVVSSMSPTRGVGGGGGGATTIINNNNTNNREQRRRERRERRHQRRLNSHNSINGPHHHHEPLWQPQVVEAGRMPPPLGGERLPDILNSHLPPPYTTLPLGLHPPPPVPHPPPPLPVPVPPPMPVAAAVSPGSPPPPPPPHHHPAGMRFPFQITPTGRRRTRGQHYTPEEEPKSCCGVVITQTVSIRWFIVMIAFVGICCAVVGTVLGVTKASGREHLTVSLLMIGVGIVLITVSGVAWRLTAHDAPSCRMMLGLGGGEESSAEPNRRFVPRLPPSYGRPHHPYAAMMYPEFQYRPPPPSYQASMQEYRLRLLLLDRHPGNAVANPGQAPGGHTVSPPPTYRSHAGSTLSRATLGLRRDQLQSDYSRPPSYRSRTSSTRPTLDPNGNTGCSTAEHSRDPSLSLSESGGGSTVVNVISVMGNASESDNLDDIKLVPDHEMPLRMMLNKGCHSGVGSAVDGAKDGNLVTIVQTGNDTSPVIVTVSGSTMATTTMGSSTSGNGVDTEMEILAHL